MSSNTLGGAHVRRHQRQGVRAARPPACARPQWLDLWV